MSAHLQEFKGSCHCGALGFSYRTTLPPARWKVRACRCRFCRAHGVLTTSDPGGRLTFQVNDLEAPRRYRFGLRTADFLLCGRCGVYLGAQIETARGAFGIVNIRAINSLAQAIPAAAAADYSAEDEQARVDRREKRWTPLQKVV